MSNDIPWMISTVITITIIAVAVVTLPMWMDAMRPDAVENRHRLVARWYGVAIIMIAAWRSAAWADLALAGSVRIDPEISWGASLLTWTVAAVIAIVCAVAYHRPIGRRGE